MSKHTPGPWAISDYKDGRYSIVIDNEGFDVAKVDYPNQEPNARLIVAAPDLLEFAEEVRRNGDTRLASMAIAVIAKATGEQP